jgi:hypothetical protein
MQKNLSCIIFLQFLIIKTLDPDSLEMLDPNPQQWRKKYKRLEDNPKMKNLFV